MARLVPHIAAIEAYKTAASLQLLPPQWRQQTAEERNEIMTEATEAGPGETAGAGSDATEQEIGARKLKLILGNGGQSHQWVKERFAPGSAPMRLEDILHMHRMVAEEAGIRYKTPGVMRDEGRQVMTGSPETGFHKGAPGSRVQQLMEQYVQFIHGKKLLDLPPIIHALVAHFFITTIHPFEDGNGRLSRLVAAGILFQRGYNGHGFYALSGYFYQHQERYYKLLFTLQQDTCPDLTEFIAFGMEALAAELQGINSFIKVKLNRVPERKVLAVGARSQRSQTVTAHF